MKPATLIPAEHPLDGRVVLRPPGFYARAGLILLGAACYVLAFPKAGITGLAWFALAPLFIACRDLPPGAAFRHYFVYTLLVNLLGFYWMGPITVPGFVISALLMALYSGLAGVMTALVTRRVPRVPYWLVAALAWAGMEYVKLLGFYAFPWLALGYSQARDLPVLQWASLFGVYGISALVIFFNALVAETVDRLRRRDRRRALWPYGGAVLALVAGAHLVGALLLDQPTFPAEPVKVAILQGGIPQDLKWDPAFRASGETFRIYERQVEKAIALAGDEPLDLVIWPESSASCYLEDTPVALHRVRGMINRSGCLHLVGTQAKDNLGTNGRERHFNGGLLMGPGGEEVRQRYYKIHLVPFAETIPFGQDSEWLHDWLAKASNFDAGWFTTLYEVTPGRGAAPWNPAPEAEALPRRSRWMPEDHRPNYPPELTDELLPAPPLTDDRVIARFGLLICFESLYPELSLGYTRQGADFLAVITNDAWFRQSAAAYQHAEVCLLRAVESRVSVLQAANAGVSLWCDPWGRPHDETPLDTEAAVVADLPEAAGPTLYMLIGDALPWTELSAIILLTLYAVVLAHRERRRTGNRIRRG